MTFVRATEGESSDQLRKQEEELSQNLTQQTKQLKALLNQTGFLEPKPELDTAKEVVDLTDQMAEEYVRLLHSSFSKLG